MVQILQRDPGPAERFLGGLQQSLPAISDLLMSHQKQKQQQSLIQSILGGPQRQEGFDQMLGMDQEAAPRELELTPEKIIAASQIDPQMAATMSRLFQGQEKERMNKQKLAAENKVGQESFNRMSELLRKGNLGLGSELKGKAFGGETAEDVGEFSSLSGALESMLVDRVSRGTLSNARFKYITETLLPKPTDRQATIKGKMKALARELNLDPSVLLGKSKLEKGDGDGFVMMRDPSGVVRRIPKNKAIAAQRAGGKLINER